MADKHKEQGQNLMELSTTVEAMSKLIIDIAQNNRPLLGGEHYISDAELSAILKISRRTLQQWRTDGVISFIMLGGKVLYKESDVQGLLDTSYMKSFATTI